ncbi:MAG TPA: hypothetical protein VHG30_13715 [Microvirga sp.]|nr:hypothetical protein [Microvirga sp.]
MWSFFKRAVPHPARALLTELDGLDEARRNATARQLALLWSAFAQEFGVSRFIEASASEQQSYLDRLDRIVERGKELKDTELARYYYSTALLRHFLEALRTRDAGPGARAIAERLVLLTEEGRALQEDADSRLETVQSSTPEHPNPVPIRPSDRR